MCDNCIDEREEYLNICEDILSNWDNEWCWDTIENIKKWIEKNEHITMKQMEAIDNIVRKVNSKLF